MASQEARRLARAGADLLLAVDLNGATARVWAAQCGHHELARWLGQHVGFTALHWACEDADPAEVRRLVRSDGVEAVTIVSLSPLHSDTD